jgi:hypothetical protein
MLNEGKMSDIFWREAVYTIVYILNRGKIKVNSDNTTYELWKVRPTSIKHFKIFGIKCYIKRDDDDLVKFYSRSDEAIFIRYSSRRKSYRCYNKRVQNIVESINVRIDEEIPHKNQLEVEETDYRKKEEEGKENEVEEEEEEDHQDTQTPSRFVYKNHPEHLILGDKNSKTQTRRKMESRFE